ncbi:membrane hypothetical protein [Vibrio chagasii]|nr:membrane hypothetical protein [Vibrio chagasii]
MKKIVSIIVILSTISLLFVSLTKMNKAKSSVINQATHELTTMRFGDALHHFDIANDVEPTAYVFFHPKKALSSYIGKDNAVSYGIYQLDDFLNHESGHFNAAAFKNAVTSDYVKMFDADASPNWLEIDSENASLSMTIATFGSLGVFGFTPYNLTFTTFFWTFSVIMGSLCSYSAISKLRLPEDQLDNSKKKQKRYRDCAIYFISSLVLLSMSISIVPSEETALNSKSSFYGALTESMDE